MRSLARSASDDRIEEHGENKGQAIAVVAAIAAVNCSSAS
jgi:hypothetical protein